MLSSLCPAHQVLCQDNVSEIMQQQLNCHTRMLAAFDDATHNIIKISLERLYF